MEKEKKIPQNLPNLILDYQIIPRVMQFKYIGLLLDPTLCWKPHIYDLCSRLNQYFGIFRYLRYKIPRELKRQVFLSTASPLINYGIELYGSASLKLLGKLQSKQNQLLKVLYIKNWFYGTNDLHNECKLIKIRDLHILRVLTFVRKCLNKETISLFHNYFVYQHDNHSYNTRHNINLVPIASRTESGATRIKALGPTYWNSNRTAQQNFKFTLDTYKHKLKDFFIGTYT